MKKILVIGSLNMDFSIKTPKMPVPGETIIGESFHLNPGGKGANQAFAIGKLGADVSMLGMVGNDEYAKLLKQNLESVNVNTQGIIEQNNTSTGVAFVTVDSNGENSIIVISGANEKVNTEFIDENINLIDDADIIVMQLEIPVDVVTYVARIAKEKNKLVVLDPAPARADLPDELFSYVDIMKPNETELSILTGVDTSNDDNIIKAGKSLVEKGVKNVIVSLGGRGSILVNKDYNKKFNSLGLTPIDTTAAGDSFTAALVSYLASDKSLEEAIQFGHVVSSIVITKKGAQESIPSLEEVRLFLENRK